MKCVSPPSRIRKICINQREFDRFISCTGAGRSGCFDWTSAEISGNLSGGRKISLYSKFIGHCILSVIRLSDYVFLSFQAGVTAGLWMVGFFRKPCYKDLWCADPRAPDRAGPGSYQF